MEPNWCCPLCPGAQNKVEKKTNECGGIDGVSNIVAQMNKAFPTRLLEMGMEMCGLLLKYQIAQLGDSS